MTTVEFSAYQMSDRADALTVEGVFQKYAGFAGIQSFQFDDKLSSWVSSHWTTITNVAYGSTLARTGTVGSNTLSWYNVDMPHSYLLEFTSLQADWEIMLRGDPVADSYYILRYSHTNSLVTLIKRYIGVNATLEEKVLSDQELVTWGRVKVAVRDAQFSSDSIGRIIYITLWIDDVLILSACDNAANSTPPLRMGFMVYSGSAATLFTNLRVSNLGEIITISSLDPAEKPIGAIQRAIEDRYIRFWSRWDGSLRAWTPQARVNTITLAVSKQLAMAPLTDTRQIINHIRVLGAFQWVRVKDDYLINKFGNRFKELQNTSLWNSDDCYTIGQQMLMRAKEQAFQAEFDTFGLYLLEPDDRIQLPSFTTSGDYVDYIIDTISWSYTPNTLRVHMTVRQYFYGEP